MFHRGQVLEFYEGRGDTEPTFYHHFIVKRVYDNGVRVEGLDQTGRSYSKRLIFRRNGDTYWANKNKAPWYLKIGHGCNGDAMRLRDSLRPWEYTLVPPHNWRRRDKSYEEEKEEEEKKEEEEEEKKKKEEEDSYSYSEGSDGYDSEKSWGY